MYLPAWLLQRVIKVWHFSPRVLNLGRVDTWHSTMASKQDREKKVCSVGFCTWHRGVFGLPSGQIEPNFTLQVKKSPTSKAPEKYPPHCTAWNSSTTLWFCCHFFQLTQNWTALNFKVNFRPLIQWDSRGLFSKSLMKLSNLLSKREIRTSEDVRASERGQSWFLFTCATFCAVHDATSILYSVICKYQLFGYQNNQMITSLEELP